MIRAMLIISLICAGIFALFMVASVAARPAARVPGAQEVTRDHKDGDMRIYWFGHGYRQRSARMTSTGNREYMGGGMHGGK